ncbi:Hypothetical predicted protein [Olea europaea subsp. europaea]|uniref:Uncharacterized protein n=1 Tax=Olea europaea subsp. europaea TaxID=158383 RepID=A0A8S0R3F4_OLEEU|nr:Hypothetical predicted protein [Olea europaea subsp. europaea]
MDAIRTTRRAVVKHHCRRATHHLAINRPTARTIVAPTPPHLSTVARTTISTPHHHHQHHHRFITTTTQNSIQNPPKSASPVKSRWSGGSTSRCHFTTGTYGDLRRKKLCRCGSDADTREDRIGEGGANIVGLERGKADTALIGFISAPTLSIFFLDY